LVSLVAYDEIFLDCSWNWLNDPELKEATNTLDFTKQSQKIWFNNLKNQADYLIWGLSYNDQPIGVCGLKNMTATDCEYWGYIGNKEYWAKGIGGIMMNLVEEKAGELNLQSIWLKVLKNNDRAIRLYNKTGYVVEKSTDEFLKMRKSL
jgi:RimJ/RimL family protein N-acetyltransferase